MFDSMCDMLNFCTKASITLDEGNEVVCDPWPAYGGGAAAAVTITITITITNDSPSPLVKTAIVIPTKATSSG